MTEKDRATSWHVVADRQGTVLHPSAQWDYLAGWAEASSGVGGDRSRDEQPLVGSLDHRTLPLLCDVLARHTSTPGQCWLALWIGFGKYPAAWEASPTFRLPHRQYWLFESPLAQVVEHSVAFATKQFDDGDPWLDRILDWGHVQSPQLWWPQDHAWAVASEIDYDSTVVGGRAALVEELVRNPDLECLPIAPDTSLYFDADRINRR